MMEGPLYLYTQACTCARQLFRHRPSWRGWKDTASTSTHSGTLSRKRAKRSPSCSQTRCIQSLFMPGAQGHIHSPTGSTTCLKGQEDEGGQSQWRVSWRSTRYKVLSCQSLDMSPGFPLSPSFPLKQKRTNTGVHESMPPCLQKEKFMVNYLARIQV